MDIVDAQVHAFYRLTEDEMIAAMDALGIQGVLIDEVWKPTEDGTSWPYQTLANGARRPLTPRAQAAAIRFPDRFALLQRVNRQDNDLAALFAMLATTPGCRAVRVNVRPKAEREAMIAGGFDELFGLACKYDLAVCVLIHGRDAATVIRTVASRHPDVRFILDHCGDPKSLGQWNENLTLAESPNLWLKWCHAHHFFDAGPYPFPGLQTQLARAIDAFGVERVIWASDITHDQGGVPWADLLYYVRESTVVSPGDREWLLGRSARAVFKWQAPVAQSNTQAG